MSSVKVLLVDDHTLMREGIASILQHIEFVQIVGKVESGEEAINAAEELQPDIILMDIVMKGMTGIEATRWIKEQNPDIKIILLSSEVSKDYITLGAKAGINGYLPKNVNKEGLVEAIRKVNAGEKYFSPSIMEIVFENFYEQESTNKKPSKKNTDLSNREMEVLEQVALGKSNKEVADALFISVKTVETHKTNILSKLGLKNTAELVKYAIKNNIIEL
ncbi:response regulator transcription factor [Fulvivirga ligni]|uniref:response regulator transcription factor n=1 Tax=Fulvivirga ligni TaxID=2904246 RepID=UPI001F39BEF6|nr:response regulator transcription factor [Fulvivirga ligni]UII22369.1 response regulator transcription factor [Fulvivirga ligni]